MVFLKYKNDSNLESSLLSTIQSYVANPSKMKIFWITLIIIFKKWYSNSAIPQNRAIPKNRAKILSARNLYRSPYFKVKNFRCIHMPNICFCFARFNYFIHTYSSNLLVLNFSVFGRSFKKKYKLCAISSLLKFIDGTIENNCEIRFEVFS